MAKIWSFDESLDFWPKFRFLSKILIFKQNFDFWAKFRFLSKISIFHQTFDFWKNSIKHSIFEKIRSKFRFLKKFDFWSKFRLLLKFFNQNFVIICLPVLNKIIILVVNTFKFIFANLYSWTISAGQPPAAAYPIFW